MRAESGIRIAGARCIQQHTMTASIRSLLTGRRGSGRAAVRARLFLVLVFGWGVATVSAADSAQAKVLAAVRRLAEQRSYAWTTSQETPSEPADPAGAPGGGRGRGSGQPGPLQGRAERGGWTYLTSTFNQLQIEIVFKGGKAALKREGEWQTAEDLEAGRNPGMARLLRGFQSPSVEAEELARKAISLKPMPATPVADAPAATQYAAELSTEGAREIMARRSRVGAQGPADARGSVRFWIHAGLLVRYQYELQGTVARPEGGVVRAERITTVTLTEIGSARVEVPPGARRRLEE